MSRHRKHAAMPTASGSLRANSTRFVFLFGWQRLLALLVIAWYGACSSVGVGHADELKPFDVRRLEQGIGSDGSRSTGRHKPAAHDDLLRSGTAFFISRSGEMLTSAHVV